MSIQISCRSNPPVDGPDDVIQAAIYMRRGNYSKALPCLQKAVDLEPDTVELLAALGLVHSKLGDNEKALECFEKCIAIDFANPVTLNIAGALHYNARNYSRAEELLNKAAKLEPKSPEPFYNMGLVSLAQGKTDRALEFFEKALAAAPGHYRALRGKSFVLAGRKKSKETNDCLRQALSVVDAEISFAVGKFEKTVAFRRQQALLHPDNPRVLLSLGSVLCAAGKLAESVEVCKKAVALDPNNAGAHIRLATTLLTAGDFKNGWKEYEWRIKAGYLHPYHIPPDNKQWNGSRIEKGNLLIICEQGYGDAIQFSRYLPIVKERSGSNIKLVCRPSLARLFEHSWNGQFAITDDIPPGSEFDFHFPLMSLPWLFGTIQETIPPAPYLKAAEKDVEQWSSKVSALKGKKVGLSWAGNPLHKRDRQRSLDFKLMKPLFRLKNISFVSLQKANAPSKEETVGLDNFHDWSADLNDFADTAALISCLDLVICVDSVVAHLSGALGQKTWTLIPFIPEWRWMRDTENSPWYPSMRLIRQKTLRGWSAVMIQMVDELRDL
jgi:tetratricopeptide (TPR) repeat protein